MTRIESTGPKLFWPKQFPGYESSLALRVCFKDCLPRLKPTWSEMRSRKRKFHAGERLSLEGTLEKKRSLRIWKGYIKSQSSENFQWTFKTNDGKISWHLILDENKNNDHLEGCIWRTLCHPDTTWGCRGNPPPNDSRTPDSMSGPPPSEIFEWCTVWYLYDSPKCLHTSNINHH